MWSASDGNAEWPYCQAHTANFHAPRATVAATTINETTATKLRPISVARSQTAANGDEGTDPDGIA